MNIIEIKITNKQLTDLQYWLKHNLVEECTGYYVGHYYSSPHIAYKLIFNNKTDYMVFILTYPELLCNSHSKYP